MKRNAAPPQNTNWHVPALFLFGVVFLLILLWVVFSHPALTYPECVLVKVILALAAAGIGAIVPGTISTNAPGIAKAGGAAAFFVIVLALFNCPSTSPNPANTGQASGGSPAPTPKEPQPPKKQEWHTEDESGSQYKVVWRIDPACHETDRQDAKHICQFAHTQTSFAGDNTPYDQWNISLEAPGPVYDVECEPLGSNEFNEVKGVTKGENDGNFARCRGWINGGDGEIKMTVLYKQKW
jgi:hypothetical protein